MQVSELIDNEYRSYAMYTIGNRAIPSLMDGLKPVQRMLVHALNKAGSGEHKTADIAGRISGYGYAHGETSAQDALSLLAAPWNNQKPLINGHGNFGSRMVPSPAAARYTFVSKNKTYEDYFSESRCVANRDPDVSAPEFYLPPLPWVLVNGIRGIAVGFACLIFPYDIDDVKKSVIDAIDGKRNRRPALAPNVGECYGDPDNYKRVTFLGKIESAKKYRGKLTVIVSDLPWSMDRKKYHDILVKLTEVGKIDDFSDNSGKGKFNFIITMSGDQIKAYEKSPIDYLKLSVTMHENLTTIDHEGNLAVFDWPEELIKAWVDARLKFYEIELVEMIEDADLTLRRLGATERMVSDVITGKFKPSDFKSKALLETAIAAHYDKEGKLGITSKLGAMPAYAFTEAEHKKLLAEISQQAETLTKYQKMTGASLMKQRLQTKKET